MLYSLETLLDRPWPMFCIAAGALFTILTGFVYTKKPFYWRTQIMSSERQPMTLLGRAKLEQELKHLLTVERPDAIRAIEEARGHGDISENADYDAAKERQGFLEGRIADIQSKIANAEVVDTATLK